MEQSQFFVLQFEQLLRAIDIAGLETFAKPALALFRSAVRESVGLNRATGLALQAVVPDLEGRLHGPFDIALFQEGKLLPAGMGPDPAEVIALNSTPHRQI